MNWEDQDAGENLLPCLTPFRESLVCLDFSKQTLLTMDETKAIGKILADGKCLRELNLE